MLSMVVIFSLSLFMSMTLVPFLMRYAKVLNLTDVPDNSRKLHKDVIPKTGGLAITLAVLLPIAYLSSNLATYAPLLAGAVLIAVVGYLDDIFNIGSWKFFGQFASVSIFIFLTPDLAGKSLYFFVDIPPWATQIFLFIFLVGATNAINLSDGLDGLAAGLSLLSVVMIAYLANDAGITLIVLISMSLTGALMGFLRYNTHPAKVFMGDTGSQFIGFVSAALAISTTQNITNPLSPILPIFIIGLPITDTLMVFSLRIWKGRSPFSADRNHIHHQLLRFGLHSYEAVSVMYFIQIAFIASAFLFKFESDVFLALMFVGLTTVVVLGLFLAYIFDFQFRPQSADAKLFERRNLVFRKLSWVYIFSTDIISLALLFVWITLILFSWGNDAGMQWIALPALLLAAAARKFQPHNYALISRLLAYPATGIALFLYSGATVVGAENLIVNTLMLFICVFLILSMKMTRKEVFEINNHDILILIILILALLLPAKIDNIFNIKVILLRTAVIIYAIEYIISKNTQRVIALPMFSAIALVVVSISQL